MRELLVGAFEDPVARMTAEEEILPLPRWSECVFRFMDSCATHDRAPGMVPFFECSDPSFHPLTS